MATRSHLSETDAADRAWRRWAACLIAGFVLIGLLLGIVVLPARDQPGGDFFTVLCRALGIPGYETLSTQSPGATAAPVSQVAWTGELRRMLAHGDRERGSTIAKDNCATCHGDDGLSTDKDLIPNLAAQSDEAIFKELRDYQTGARVSELMTPPVQALDAQQMADVAAFYAAMPPASEAVAAEGVSPDIVRLVSDGDAARGVPGCDSCHGASKSGPEGAPLLVGMPLSYLERQLQNFANGSRHNDLFERMRTIARILTPDEIHRLAIYYSGNPLPQYKK